MPLFSRLLRKAQKEKDPRQAHESPGSRSAASSSARRPAAPVRSLTWAGHVDDSSTDDFEDAFLAFLNQPDQPFTPRVAAGITEEDQDDYSQFTLAAKVDYNFPRRRITPAASATATAAAVASSSSPAPQRLSLATRDRKRETADDGEEADVRKSETAEGGEETDDQDRDDDQDEDADADDDHARNESFDSGICVRSVDPSVRKRGGSDDSLDLTTWLPSEIWEMVANHLAPSTAAALTMTGRRMYRYLGNQYLDALNAEENREEKASFLHHFEDKLPQHILCWQCGVYHHRQDASSERLGQYESACPRYRADAQSMLSRDRLIPWDLVHLATRAARHTPAHGIPTSALTKKWTSESGWKHTTRALLVDTHLVLRASSLSWVEAYMSASELRVVVDERYHERFSHCKHISNSLDKYAKCAVSHIRPGYQVTAQCAACRPLRRCNQCPSEYLIEIKLVEDRQGPRSPLLPAFRHALSVTRWSDLGAGTSPHASLEWRAARSPLFETWAAQKVDFWSLRTVRSRFEAKDGNRVPEVPAQDLKNSMRWQLARLAREREENRERQERASDLESERRRMRRFLAYSRANTEPLVEHARP